jgi:hypothetical protein
MDFSGLIISAWGQLGDWSNSLLQLILAALPDSPFQILTRNSAIVEVIGYVNYFIPVSFMVSVLQAWIVAVGSFYIWQVLLRWVKAID